MGTCTTCGWRPDDVDGDGRTRWRGPSTTTPSCSGSSATSPRRPVEYLRPFFALEAPASPASTPRVCTADGHAGAACWDPPGHWRTSHPRRPARGRPDRASARGAPAPPKALSGLDAIEKAHPSTPHWYLAVLGTDPDHQGKGIGARADGAGARPLRHARASPPTSSRSKESNVPYYERFGFEVRRRGHVPGTGPRVWPMWRDPQPSPDERAAERIAADRRRRFVDDRRRRSLDRSPASRRRARRPSSATTPSSRRSPSRAASSPPTGAQTDDELWELIAAFGPLLDTQLGGATPDDVRDARASSTRLRDVADAGRRRCSTCCSRRRPPRGTSARPHLLRRRPRGRVRASPPIDLHTSDDELAAIERFRGLLLGAIEAMERHAAARRRRPRTAAATADRSRRRPQEPPASRSRTCSPSSTPSSA